MHAVIAMQATIDRDATVSPPHLKRGHLDLLLRARCHCADRPPHLPLRRLRCVPVRDQSSTTRVTAKTMCLRGVCGQRADFRVVWVEMSRGCHIYNLSVILP